MTAYALAFTIQSGSHYFILRVVTVNLSYLMGVCEFFIAFTKDIEHIVNEIDECIQDKHRHHEMKKKFGEFIQMLG